MLCITCVDALLGTDMDRVCRKAEQQAGVPVRPCYMYALTRESRKPPMAAVRQTLYSLLQPAHKNPRAVNLLGYFSPLQEDCELYVLLRQMGLKEIREISRCKNYTEYLAMSQANFNLVLHPESRLAASDLEKRLQKSFYVGMFDMNDLKGINDGHGHHSGDIALQRFAAVLKAAFPAGNAFFRMGGDEFLCILYGMELPAIQERIAALRSMLKHTPVSLADGTAAVLSFSCGFALHAPGAPVDDVTQSADRTMYEEKRKFKANSL